MYSPFSSALAKLDDTIEVVLHQLESLVAAREVNEQEVAENLRNAAHQAAILRDLISAEDPHADWSDRAGLEQLFAEFEAAAKARHNEQRRARLLNLANELDAGTIKHRFEARTTALNTLRLNAVRELRTEAALPEQTKDLPGPSADEWLLWACNLDDTGDAVILGDLRRDFAALERFTSEMDAAYWTPGQPERPDPPSSGSGSPPADNTRAGAVPSKPVTSVRPIQRNRADNVQEQMHTAVRNGDYTEALSLSYQPGSALAIAEDEAGEQLETAGPAQATDLTSPATLTEDTPSTSPGKYCEKCGGIFPASLYACPDDDSVLKTIEKPDIEEAIHDSTSTAKDSAVQSEAPAEEGPALDARKELAGFDEAAPARRPVLAWAGAGALLVAVGLAAVVYQVHARKNSKDLRPVAKPDTAAAAPETDAAGLALLHKQPVEGAQEKILLSLELCKYVNSGGIECWGYASNLGNENSRVSLAHADVVDGKGNNFSVNNKGPLSFASGNTVTLAAGSRERYSLKFPETHRDARTLTLYVDLSSPPSLEYTFRDIPVID